MIVVSIIIVTYNSQDEIVDCLRSLLPQLKDIQGEIIIVDNNSVDDSVKIINELNNSNISLIQNKENSGYTKANNQGIDFAKGDYFFLLNPDTIVPNGTIKHLVNELHGNESIGAIAPQLRFPDGRIQHSCRRFPRRRDILYESIGLSKIFKYSAEFNYWKMGDFDHMETKLVDQPAGAAILIKRSILKKIGNLDEQFPMFFSDVDLCKRIWDVGTQINFAANTFIYHVGGVSIYRNRAKMILSSHLSFWKYFNKYHKGIPNLLLNLLSGLFLMLFIPIRILLNILFPSPKKGQRRSL